MLNIIQDRDGYLVDGILFPVVSKGSSQWVQSPYTSYAIKNKKRLDFESLIEEHITKNKNKSILPYWMVYCQAKRYYGNISYKNFMENKFKEFANYGYSKNLLKVQKIK